MNNNVQSRQDSNKVIIGVDVGTQASEPWVQLPIVFLRVSDRRWHIFLPLTAHISQMRPITNAIISGLHHFSASSSVPESLKASYSASKRACFYRLSY
ncbi:hypothetical protein [Xenorhabdus sp. PB62.4]|uniref:hypothetical protein n=1 Tax=Xenorhabdus sp. PB62.4 TaxID=1851573 RepID=UPI00165731A9|nr:hypothetical protein [Xenorhabdus sp. PB62.4]MBC8953746.1 hypothetical protein [Xenorhabdus sp. PB62.4]